MITAAAALLCGASCLPLLAVVLLCAADQAAYAWLAFALACALMAAGTELVHAAPLPLAFTLAALASLAAAYRAGRRTDRETGG